MIGNATAAWAALGFYLIVCTILLYWTLRQGRLSGESRGIVREALGTARYPWFILAVVVSATMLGPADALGLSENGYKYGVVWALAPIGAALAQIVAGLFLVHRIKAQPGSPKSLGDFFGPRFGRSAQIAVGCLIVIQAIPFAGLLTLAGAQILDTFLGVPKIYGLLGTAMVIGLYTATGGLQTIVRTDIFQGGLMLLLLVIILVTTAILALSTTSAGHPIPTITEAFNTEFAAIGLFAAASTYFFGELLLPVYAQRILMARSPRDARIGFVLAGLLAAFWYLVISSAGAASWAVGGIDNPEFVLLHNIGSVTSGAVTTMLVVAAFLSLLALTHSTFDAVLNTGGTALARDVVNKIIPLDEIQQGSLSRFAMVVLAALGMIIPFRWDDLIDILLVGYTLWAPTMMPIFVWIVLSKPQRYPALTFWLPVITGIAAWRLCPWLLGEAAPAVFIGVVANAVVLLMLTRWYAGRGKTSAIDYEELDSPAPATPVA